MADPDELTPMIRWYIAMLATAAAAGLALGFGLQGVTANGLQWLYGGVFGLTVLAAQWFPIHLTDKTKIFVDAAALTALALMLPAPAAAAAAGLAIAIHQFAIRTSLEQRVFNIAQTVLYVLVGSMAFHAIGGGTFPPDLDRGRGWVGVAASLALMHVLNTASVSVVVAMQLGRQPVEVWTETIAVDLPEHLALVGFGVLLVVAAGTVPWLLTLLPGPMVLVYLSLKRSAELRKATRATIDAIADLSDLLGREVPGHSRRVAARTRQLGQQLGLPERELDIAARAAQLRGIDVVHGGATVQPGGRSSRAALLAAQMTRNGDVAAAVRYQEERWDGSGCPAGLAGDAIPLAARLIAVADAFERLAPSIGGSATQAPSRAAAAVAANAGRAWDPAIVGALMDVVQEPPGGV